MIIISVDIVVWTGASFENALVMRADFVIPRARKGKKDANNLVACCVLARREELRKVWHAKTARP